ncbi:unnamed protein product, partial [Amoebophrya sp. A25]
QPATVPDEEQTSNEDEQEEDNSSLILAHPASSSASSSSSDGRTRGGGTSRSLELSLLRPATSRRSRNSTPSPMAAETPTQTLRRLREERSSESGSLILSGIEDIKESIREGDEQDNYGRTSGDAFAELLQISQRNDART